MSARGLTQPLRRRFWLLLGLVLLGGAPVAGALEVTISAQYRGGGSGRFENTTPPGGLCQGWPATCRNRMTVNLPITYSKKTTKGAVDSRDEFFLQLPGRREVDVFHEQTGEPRRMTFEWTAVSQKVLASSLNHHPLYQPVLSSGCRFVGSTSQFRPAIVTYLWDIGIPQSPVACWANGKNAPVGRVEVATVLETSVAYAMDIPPPYRLKAGTYRGSQTYSIGPGGDFDFGNDVTELSGGSLTVNFVLDVQHAFIFEFPPGSDRAVLEPQGGWNAWLTGGRRPGRLYRDLPFRLWSTGPFKVYKQCQYEDGDRCGIRNDDSDQVPVTIALTLPAGVEHRGATVNRLALPTGRSAALQFEAATPTLNRAGQLHFEVARDDVGSMLAHPGSTYTGQVTVVFDAEL
ncbi:hypothetical protein D3C81_315480 [compost metagenome]|nr:hypothetical protein UB47_01045 [Pseudomonas sp. 5]